MKFVLTIFSAFFLLFYFAAAPFACSESAIAVSQHQQQTPILIGIKNNPAIRLSISIPQNSKDVRLTAVAVKLQDGGDPADLKALRLFYTDGDSLFRPASPPPLFGAEQTPATKTIFQGEQPLSPGAHTLWLCLEPAANANLHHKIGATIDKVTFSDGTVVIPKSTRPSILQRIGVAVRQHGQDDVDTYRIPGLATTNNGTLLAVYDVRRARSRDLQGDIDIGLSRSTDGGKTWEPMRIVLDMDEFGGLPQKFNGVSDACILVDENSDNITVAGLWMHGVLDENGKWINGLTEQSTAWEHQWQRKGSQPGFGVKQTSQFLITKSSDDGRTWSEPVNLTKMCKRPEWWLWAPAPGRGITLEDGTLVFPSQGRDEKGKPFSNITWSRDGGRTWKTSNPAGHNTTECAVVQLSDGSLMLNIRDNRNRKDDSEHNGRSIYTTSDLGKTWTEHPTSRRALIESTCMASLYKHTYTENGVQKSILLFSNPNTKQGRHHTTIKVSFDDGATWPEKYWLLLDEGDNRGYSCLTAIDEQTIGILYEGSRADMTFESIPLRELIHLK